MRYRNVTQNEDGTYNIVWFGSSGKLSDNKKIPAENYTIKQEGIAKSLIQHLAVIKGELWYAAGYGLPLFDKIKHKAILDSAVISIIERHVEVQSILSFESSIDKENKTYYFTANILSIYGDQVEVSTEYPI